MFKPIEVVPLTYFYLMCPHCGEDIDSAIFDRHMESHEQQATTDGSGKNGDSAKTGDPEETVDPEGAGIMKQHQETTMASLWQEFPPETTATVDYPRKPPMGKLRVLK